MIDHVSVAVRDIEAATRFYDALARHDRSRSNCGTRPDDCRLRQEISGVLDQSACRDDNRPRSGAHICFRARTTDTVDAFHAAALAAGGTSDGAPGLRPEYGDGYYAAFIRDPDGNRIEAVTFVET